MTTPDGYAEFADKHLLDAQAVLAECLMENGHPIAKYVAIGSSFGGGEHFAFLWGVTCAVANLVSRTGLLHHGHACDSDCHTILQFVDPAGRLVDADQAPPRYRLIGRWWTAAHNDDLDTAEALFFTINAPGEFATFVADLFGTARLHGDQIRARLATGAP